MDKKGVVFTFIVIALLSVVLIAFLLNISNKNSQAKIQDTNVKIETINSFTRTLNQELLPQALRSSSNRVVLSWLQYLDEVNIGLKNQSSGVFIIGNLNSTLKEGMVSGSYRGIILNHMNDISTKSDYTLPSIFREIRVLGQNSGINFSYDDPKNYDFNISLVNAWQINITMQVSAYNVSDMKGETFWIFKTQNFSITLNVSNFREPFMLVFDDRNVTINRTRTTDFVNFNNFQNFYRGPEYREHSDAPSFLDRLQNITNANAFGIETILDPTPAYFPNPPLGDTNTYSAVDFQYWRRMVPPAVQDDLGCAVDGFTDLYLNTTHLQYYSRKNDGNDFCPLV